MYKASNMKEVVENSIKAGWYYFDDDTMAFWGSEICTELFDNDTFVICEDNFDRSKRLYSVRKYNHEDASVDTIVFQKFDKLKDAIACAKECD